MSRPIPVYALDQQRLVRLIEVGRGILGDLDLDSLLERILDVACELTGARYAAIGVLDERREELERFVTRGIDAPTHAAIGALPSGHGVLGTLIRDPRPLRLADVGAHPDSWGFPAGHPPMTTFLGVPITIHGEAFGNLYLTDKKGGEFDDADEQAMLVLADWATIAIHNAEAHRTVRVRRDELERAVSGFEATLEIARAVGSETSLDRVLELIVKRGRALVKARAMAVLVQDGEDVVVTAIAGDLDAGVLGTRLPLAAAISGHVLKTGLSERLTDARHQLRSGLAARIDASSGLYVPLLHQGRALGVLNAFDRLEGGPEFDQEDERLMTSFAASAAVAIATAQNAAAQSLRRSIEAAEDERSRWARELHDDTLQDLAALSIQLSAARTMADIEQIRAGLDDAISQVGAAADNLRGLITELRPPSLDQLGVQPALEALADRNRALHGLDIDLRVDLSGPPGRSPTRLAPDIESAVYRMVQEGLTNIVRHATANAAWVSVAEADRSITVSIRDDGQGFSPWVKTSGFGLLGMQERVSLLGGSIDIQSAPGAGTTLRATLPVVRADQVPEDEVRRA
jgi:signal transduction histidine kinase